MPRPASNRRTGHRPASAGGVRALAVTAAPGLFVLLWSTGFIGAKYALPYGEPFVLLGLRLLIASALLAGLAGLTRSERLRTRAQYGRSATTGVLLHAAYLGGVFWAIDHGFPAGVASVVVSLQPVLVAICAGVVLDERLGWLQWAGLLLGVVGVGLVLEPGLTVGGLTSAGVLACVVALSGGTAGTLHQKRYGGGIPLLSGTAVQYAAASAVLLLAAAGTESFAIDWSWQLVAALAWLVVVLSLGAVLLLLFLLKRGTASGVSSLFYLVPPATAVEAYLLFGEKLAVLSLIGIVVATVGVALASRRTRTPAA